MSDDYEVGYGKPPLETRFQKGQSGNAQGRKRGSKNLASMVQSALDETVVVNINGKRRCISKLEAACMQQANKAAAGDPKAMKLMMDLLAGAQTRDAGRDEDAAAKATAQRHKLALQALATRIETDGGDDEAG
jgi:hypothetical protein